MIVYVSDWARHVSCQCLCSNYSAHYQADCFLAQNTTRGELLKEGIIQTTLFAPNVCEHRARLVLADG
jgi:hypothetical protein